MIVMIIKRAHRLELQQRNEANIPSMLSTVRKNSDNGPDSEMEEVRNADIRLALRDSTT